MPVYLITLHAYRSWSEADPRGFVQRTKPGIQPSNAPLARHRAAIAKDMVVRFTRHQMEILLDQVFDAAELRALRGHCASATATHVHMVISWREQAFQEGTRMAKVVGQRRGKVVAMRRRMMQRHGDHRVGDSTSNSGGDGHGERTTGVSPDGNVGEDLAHEQADAVADELKHVLGWRLSEDAGRKGCRWFSRGWDAKRVWEEDHLRYLMYEYLPGHEQQGGVFRAFPRPRTRM